MCEAVDVMYDMFGSSVPLAELLSANGVISTLQHLATNFNQRVSTKVSYNVIMHWAVMLM